MAEPEPKPGKKATLQRKWTPEMFALYLLQRGASWAIPSVSAAEIRGEFPELGMSKERIDTLRNDPEFEATVRREFTDKIKDKSNLERMFLVYLRKIWDANMDSKNPSAKILDILGYMTGLYNPKEIKKPPPPMNAAAKARMIHEREQAEANKRKREEGIDGG